MAQSNKLMLHTQTTLSLANLDEIDILCNDAKNNAEPFLRDLQVSMSHANLQFANCFPDLNITDITFTKLNEYLIKSLDALILQIESKNKVNRIEVGKKLNALLILLNNYLHNSEYLENSEVIKKLNILLDSIHKEFKINMEPDWIHICKRNNLSPISHFSFIDNNIKRLHQLFSNKRRNLAHIKIFKNKPITNLQINFRGIKSKKIRSCIFKLTAEQGIVDGTKIYHWTTQANLLSILRNGFFFGNKTLAKNLIFFHGNVLSICDILNGDENVICFAPYMVDHYAAISRDQTSVRESLIRIKINVHNIAKENAFNQFFKLCDLLAPHFCCVQNITDRLKIKVWKDSDNELKLEICLDQLKFTTVFQANDMIFYGNIFSINRFCLYAFFKAIKSNAQFELELLKYFDSLKEDELKNHLITITKCLVVFSEYNFNGNLEVTDNLISEIYFANQNKVLDVKGMGTKKTLTHLAESGEKILANAKQPKIPYVFFDTQNNHFLLYNNPCKKYRFTYQGKAPVTINSPHDLLECEFISDKKAACNDEKSEAQPSPRPLSK